MRKKWISFGIVAVVVAMMIVAWFWKHQRAAKIANSFYLASSPDNRQSDVLNLGQYRGDDINRLLIQVASNKKASNANREMAVEVLSSRPGDDLAPPLSRLLVPSSPLGLRLKVTESLRRMHCEYECITNILHFRERIWRGELPEEDLLTPLALAQPEEVRKSTEYSTKEQQTEIIRRVDSLLSRSESTNDVLQDIYGLGGPTPSPFSLYIVEEARLHGACTLLRESQTWMQKNSDIYDLEKQIATVRGVRQRIECIPSSSKG